MAQGTNKRNLAHQTLHKRRLQSPRPQSRDAQPNDYSLNYVFYPLPYSDFLKFFIPKLNHEPMIL